MVNAVAAARSIRPLDCRERAVRRFSANAMVAGYEEIYHRVVVSHGFRDLRPYPS
jgi:hypothetical protein